MTIIDDFTIFEMTLFVGGEINLTNDNRKYSGQGLSGELSETRCCNGDR